MPIEKAQNAIAQNRKCKRPLSQTCCFVTSDAFFNYRLKQGKHMMREPFGRVKLPQH